MKLFISYARVDKPYCIQIVDMLDVHDVWYDHRLYAGQRWWEQILKMLDWCEGFVYLLSPESVASDYCQREFEIAQKHDKHIFPVLIHKDTPIPRSLKEIQHADLSNGLDVKAVKQLLNAIYIADRHEPILPKLTMVVDATVEAGPLVGDPVTAIQEAANAMSTGNFDRAVYLLEPIKVNGLDSRYISVDPMLEEAKKALEKQTKMREAQREYIPIASLVKNERTQQLGCEAFHAFRQDFPDYDPDNLASTCISFSLPLLEWCSVPAGKVVIEYGKKRKNYYVEAFRISKYPVTNAQFQEFLDAPDGYHNERWWNFSPHADDWHKEHPDPLEPKFPEADHPRGNVCWYEAMAFCRWLSFKTGMSVTLPTEQQWQRAAQGDDSRPFPWGTKFDKNRANTKESNVRMTTPVTKYPKSMSPFGVFDMAGNVWEWCLNGRGGENGNIMHDSDRIVRGGSFISEGNRAQVNFFYSLNPLYRYATIGFRVVCAAAPTP